MINLQQTFLIFGSLLGFLGIAAGAFGSHLLKTKLSSEFMSIFEVAVRYQIYNALSLIALTALLGMIHSIWFAYAGGFLILGTFIFSGSLFLLALSGVHFWGAVTPIGGVLILLGWLSIFFGALFGKAHIL